MVKLEISITADAYKAKGEDIISEEFFDKEFMVKSEFERGG